MAHDVKSGEFLRKQSLTFGFHKWLEINYINDYHFSNEFPPSSWQVDYFAESVLGFKVT